MKEIEYLFAICAHDTQHSSKAKYCPFFIEESCLRITQKMVVSRCARSRDLWQIQMLAAEIGRDNVIARSCISSRMHNNVPRRRRVEIPVNDSVNFDLAEIYIS